jgi:hypothetical protein
MEWLNCNGALGLSATPAGWERLVGPCARGRAIFGWTYFGFTWLGRGPAWGFLRRGGMVIFILLQNLDFVSFSLSAS